MEKIIGESLIYLGNNKKLLKKLFAKNDFRPTYGCKKNRKEHAMTKIEIYDIEAEEIDDLADEFECTHADIVEALLNMLHNEASLLDLAPSSLLAEHI